MNSDLIFDGMYGLAIADALGVPFETETLASMRESPCEGMVGYGHHNQPAGSWSDDTSMSLCVADSLARGYNPTDMMKRFSRWRYGGGYTATGRAFDVGRTCGRAIGRFREGCPAEYCGDYDIGGNGNGALMRTFPIALYQCLDYQGDRVADFLLPIHEASGLTHAH